MSKFLLFKSHLSFPQDFHPWKAKVFTAVLSFDPLPLTSSHCNNEKLHVRSVLRHETAIQRTSEYESHDTRAVLKSFCSNEEGMIGWRIQYSVILLCLSLNQDLTETRLRQPSVLIVLHIGLPQWHPIKFTSAWKV